MNREQREMALWAAEYSASRLLCAADRAAAADAAVAQFRQRYPVEPAAPPAVWYDEPPFAKDGRSYPCWVDGGTVHGDVHWSGSEWMVYIVGSAYEHPLRGRPVSPIIKPREPTP